MPILEALDTQWVLRRGVESEALVAVAMLSTITQRLQEESEAAPWKGKQRYLYVNSGRALKYADAAQSLLLQILQKEKECPSCIQKLGKCR